MERRVIDYEELSKIIIQDEEILKLIEQRDKLYSLEKYFPIKLDIKKKYIRAIPNPVKDKIDALNNRIVILANHLIKQYIKDKI